MVFRQSDSPVINRTIKSLEKELYLWVVERLFIYHHVKKGHTKDTIRDKTQKCEVFFPIISFTDKIKATESKRCCAVLSKICADLFSAKDWQAFLTKIFGTETKAKPIKTQENIWLRTKLTRSSLKDRPWEMVMSTITFLNIVH